jgi:hypothetical protein
MLKLNETIIIPGAARKVNTGIQEHPGICYSWYWNAVEENASDIQQKNSVSSFCAYLNKLHIV